MSVQVLGAGVGRTGTSSLQRALQRLLGGPCYHMTEIVAHPEHIAVWRAAAQGDRVDWHNLLRGYRAAVDWPAAAFWPELSAAFPNALVVLSVRDAESWWQSVNKTIFPATRRMRGPMQEMVEAVFAARFTSRLEDRSASIDAFERHNAGVRNRVASHRLLEWRPSDGWAPLCERLRLPVPSEPFPHENTAESFQSRFAPPT